MTLSSLFLWSYLYLLSLSFELEIKAEYLGIGAFGNRRGAPDAEADEFSSSLLKVLGNEKMKARALELAKQSKKRGGAKAASDKILELAVWKLKIEIVVVV